MLTGKVWYLMQVLWPGMRYSSDSPFSWGIQRLHGVQVGCHSSFAENISPVVEGLVCETNFLAKDNYFSGDRLLLMAPETFAHLFSFVCLRHVLSRYNQELSFPPRSHVHIIKRPLLLLQSASVVFAMHAAQTR